MTNFIELNTSRYPVTESQIRAENPNTSFPQPFEAPEGFAVVFQAPQPEHDRITRTVREIAPELTAKGHWEQRWEVVPRFVEYTDEQGSTHTVAEQEAAAIAAAQAAAAAALQSSIVSATQARLDAFARTRNYDGILSAATYATSTVPKFAAEGQYAVQARDATWAALYQILAAVEAGTRPAPTGYPDIEAELPALVWPAA